MPEAPLSVTDDVHSRSTLAGYDSATLHNASILIVGAGALGQNLAQNLALSGVGMMVVVDFDVFEPHNATRSPFFPWQGAPDGHAVHKAPFVAERCAAISTAPEPSISSLVGLIQQFGDAPIAATDVVVSAVDDVSARAWLAERSRLHGKPMVEGGFEGPAFTFSTFSSAGGRACYRCHNPYRESSASCTRYALNAEARNTVPAIQSTAAVLGGFMAEQVIQALHGKTPAVDARFYGDIRRMAMHRNLLQVSAVCPGEHHPAPHLGLMHPVDYSGSVADLAQSLLEEFGQGTLHLSEPFHVDYPCTGCSRMCTVRSTESIWLAESQCVDCGGSWPRGRNSMPSSVLTINVPGDLTADSPLAQLPMSDLGIKPGGAVLYDSSTMGKGLLSFA